MKRQARQECLPLAAKRDGKRLYRDRVALRLAYKESVTNIPELKQLKETFYTLAVHRGVVLKSHRPGHGVFVVSGYHDPMLEGPKPKTPKPGSVKPRSALQVAIFFVRDLCLKTRVRHFGASGHHYGTLALKAKSVEKLARTICMLKYTFACALHVA